MKRILCLLLTLSLLLPLIPSAVFASSTVSGITLESVAWGTEQTAVTVTCPETAKARVVLAAIYVDDRMYGSGMLSGTDGVSYTGTVNHLPLKEGSSATLKVFQLDADTYAPLFDTFSETLTVELSGSLDKPAGVADEQIVRLLYDEEISDWNPMHPSSASTWANWIDTLVEYDNYGVCQPCLAESWEVSADGLTWTFKIREGVRWQHYDGTFYGSQYVTAEDWVTTAKWILDPANTARTADQLFDMVGAEDYYLALEAGQTADWSTVGIRAISKYELQYTLTEPCPWFLSRLTYNWGYPTSAKFLEEQGERFGTDNTTILYCGAFLCTEWESESYRLNERNPYYWDIDNVHITRIEETYNAEASDIAVELFLAGELTSAEISDTQVDEWMNAPEKASMIHPARGSTYNYWFLFNFMPTYEERNVNGLQLDHEQWLAAANNLNFRKSIYYGLDRLNVLSVYDPYNPEANLARTVTVPDFCDNGKVDYAFTDPLKPYTTSDQFQAAEAIKYRDLAKAELEAAGVSLPIVAYMPYNTGGQDGDMAVVVTQQLENLLGSDFIRFVVEGYPATDYLNNCRRSGNYSFQLCYWGPDYQDPMTFTDPFRLGQAYAYLWRADGAATQVPEGTEGARKGRNGWDETWWINHDYTDMTDAANREVIDMEKRYNALAECEAWLLDSAYVVPVGAISGCGYEASYLNPFESQYAPFGVSSARYKYQWVYESSMDSETYLEELENWRAERAKAIAKGPQQKPSSGTNPPVEDETGDIFKTYAVSDYATLNTHDDTAVGWMPYSDLLNSPLWRAVPDSDGLGYHYVGDLAADLPVLTSTQDDATYTAYVSEELSDGTWAEVLTTVQGTLTTWQFQIRDEAVWQNGEALTAEDLIYSWQKLLDPNMENELAGDFYNSVITILNAQAYFRGDCGWEDVGIKVLADCKTIQLTCIDEPVADDICSHFTTAAFAPVYKAYYEAGMNADGTETSYGSSLNDWMGCGPYTFTTWMNNSYHLYTKNEDHWMADYFPYETVKVYITDSQSEQLELFEDGELHMMTPDSDTVEAYIDDARLVSYSSTGIEHLDINNGTSDIKNANNPIADTAAWRKAIYHAIDREYIAREFFGYQQPAGWYVNGQAGLWSESGLTFRESDYGKAIEEMVAGWSAEGHTTGYNPSLARQYLREAYAEKGLSANATIECILLYGSSESAWTTIAQWLDTQFDVIFEGLVDLKLQEFPDSLSITAAKREYAWDLSPNLWTRGASRTYPYQCFYYYTSDYSSHPNNYLSARFDAQYNYCASIQDGGYDDLLKATYDLEMIYLEEVIHCPVVQLINYELMHEDLPLPVQTFIPGFGWGAIFGGNFHGAGVEPPASGEPDDPTPVTGTDPFSDIAYSEDTTYAYLYDSEVSTMNYLSTFATHDLKVLSNFVDTLVEYDNYGNLVPCLAESWEVSDDGLTWTFKIREGVKWYTCEGEEYADLTAHDFVTAARLVVNPAFNAAYPDLLIAYIVNGIELYNWSDENGKPDYTTLGVEALDDYTLVYHLRQPCAYFLTLLTHGGFLPIYGEFYESLVIENPEPVINDDGTEGDPITNEFGTDRDKILYCGGYLCSSWIPGYETIWVKNENYWDADNIFIEKVSGKYNAQATAIAPALYLRGEIDECQVTASILDDWMESENAEYVHSTMPNGFTQYLLLCFNQKHEDAVAGGYYDMAVNNKNFRKSIYHGIDYQYALSAYDPYSPESIALTRMIPDGFCVTDSEDYCTFTDNGAFNDAPFDADLAMDYAAIAQAELEAEGCVFPIEIPMYYNPNTPNMDLCFQLLETQLEATLGSDYIDITVYAGPSTNYIAEVRRPGIWGLFEGGWGPDYADPATFFEPFSFGWTYGSPEYIKGAQYRTGYIYTQKDFDNGVITDETMIGTEQFTWYAMVEKARAETQDLERRYQLFAEAEAYALEEVLLIPFRQLNNGYVASNMTVFDGQLTQFGICQYKLKGRHMLEKSYNMDEYMTAKTLWQQAR